MLAYAAGRQRVGAMRSSPSTMLMIIGGHVAVVALAMSAKFIVDQARADPPIIVTNIPLPKDPPPPPPPENPRPAVNTTTPKSDPYVPPAAFPTPLPGPELGTTTEPNKPTGPIVGNDPPKPLPFTPPVVADPVRVGPRFATPADAVRPPYPSSKLDSQEEASLRLRLSIDERGRVVAVDPVGRNDPAFLNAARRHLIAKWRYQPATVDGKAIASTTLITLRFELEG